MPENEVWTKEEIVNWTKPSDCLDPHCVEAVAVQGDIVVRDSKDKNGPRLHFTPDEWDRFLAAVARGEYATKRLQELAQAAQR